MTTPENDFIDKYSRWDHFLSILLKTVLYFAILFFVVAGIALICCAIKTFVTDYFFDHWIKSLLLIYPVLALILAIIFAIIDGSGFVDVLPISFVCLPILCIVSCILASYAVPFLLAHWAIISGALFVLALIKALNARS